MMKKQERIDFLIQELEKLYPNPPIPLHHQDAFTLLIAVLLSAQTTDKKVNEVTPALFARANNAKEMMQLEVEEIKEYIKQIGLSNTKAKNIRLLSEMLVEKYDGEVPSTFEQLEELPGVGHKTASVVMAQWFGIPAFPVDTHIHRLMKLWKLTKGKNVEETERDAKRIFPREVWNKLHIQIIMYGREYSPARGWSLEKDFITRKMFEKIVLSKNNLFQGSRERKSLYDVAYLRDGKKKPIVIFSHGFKGFKDHGCFDLMAKFWATNHFAFIKYNFSYNGIGLTNTQKFTELEAFGENNYSTELDDLGLVISHAISGDWIPEKEINRDEVYLIGHSRGGGITILKGIEDPRVKKIATLGAISYLDRFRNYSEQELEDWKDSGVYRFQNMRTQQWMPMNYQFYEDYIQHENRLSIEKNIQNLSIPYLNLHGDADETVSVEEAKNLKRWNPTIELQVLAGVNHAFGSKEPWTEGQLPEDFLWAMELIRDFFLEKK